MLKHLCGAAILGAGLALTATSANAVTLNDPSGLSSVTFDETTGAFTSWLVNGVEQLKTAPAFSGLYYSFGGNPESLLSGGTAGGLVTIPGVGQQVTVTVARSEFTATLNFQLDDTLGVLDPTLSLQGSIQANVALSNFSVIDFTDLDLQGTNLDDSVTITPPNMASQIDQAADVGYDAAFAFAWSKDLGTLPTDNTLLFGFSKTIKLDGSQADATATDLTDPGTTAGYQAGTAALGRELNDTTPTVLTNDTSVPSQVVVPEPTTTLLSLLGLSALGSLALRRRAAK